MPAQTAPVATGDARIAQLEQDVHHIALFARALLALLEERGVVSEAQFQQALAKLESDSPR